MEETEVIQALNAYLEDISARMTEINRAILDQRQLLLRDVLLMTAHNEANHPGLARPKSQVAEEIAQANAAFDPLRRERDELARQQRDLEGLRIALDTARRPIVLAQIQGLIRGIDL